jgi:hypothetical protein
MSKTTPVKTLKTPVSASALPRSFLILVMTAIIAILLVNPAFFALAADEPADGQELRSGLLNLSTVKEEMQAAGIGVARVNDLITEGFIYLNNQDYNNTRAVISRAYALKDIAFRAKDELAAANALYQDSKKWNVSLIGSTGTQVEFELNYSQKEFEKENYEEALRTLVRTKGTILSSINYRYGYLNESILTLDKKISKLGLSQYRITTLKGTISEALAKGSINELEIIKKEAEDLNQSLIYYDEIWQAIPSLESKNLTTQVIKDGLAEAASHLGVADYKAALGELESLKKMIEAALRLEAETNAFEITLGQGKTSYHISFGEPEALLEKSKYALTVGNYAEAEQQLKKAKEAFDSTKAQFLVESAAKQSPIFSTKAFVEKNWLHSIIILAIIILAILLTKKAWSNWIRRKHLARAEKELKVSEKMVRELQKDYFIHKKTGKESYDQAYDAVQGRIMALKERISLLNKKISTTNAKRIKK